MYFVDPNGIKLEFAAYTRAFGPKDVGVPPVNAEGLAVESKAMAPA